MENDFLPEGYKAPESKSNYLKFEEGSTKFRILSKSIVGWLDWSTEKKPLRTRIEPKVLVNPTKPAKHFWAFVVWDYKSSTIKILELTQRTIQNSIISYYTADGWGNPTGYDITVVRKGKDLNNTEYTIIPTPPKPVEQEILITYASKKINLEALFDGADPFAEEEVKPVGRELKQFPVKENTINPFEDEVMKTPF